MTKVGIGYSQLSNSHNNGLEAISIAIKNGNITKPTLVIAFTTSRHNENEFLTGIKKIIGPDVKLIGGLAVGIITNKDLGYDGYQSGVAIIESDTIVMNTFVANGMHESEFETGAKLAKSINDFEFNKDPNLLLFYDAVNRTSGRLKINFGTEFIAGLYSVFTEMPKLAGGGLMGDMYFSRCSQFFNNEINANNAMALAFSGNAKMHQTIMHGCLPASAYHTVTKSDGAVLLEIDNISAIDFVMEKLNQNGDMKIEDFGFFITIGINRGNKYGDFDMQHYSNFMCANVDKKRGGLVMVENNLVEGTQIQLMRRTFDFDYIKTSTEKLLANIKEKGEQPVFAFYIDCAGRAAYYMGTDKEEGIEVQKALGNIPLLGFYSGVEISEVAGKYSPLDWTGVLTIITE